MVAYDRVLSGLCEVTSQHAGGPDDDSGSDATEGEDGAQAQVAAAADASSKSSRAAKKAAKAQVLLGCCLGLPEPLRCCRRQAPGGSALTRIID